MLDKLIIKDRDFHYVRLKAVAWATNGNCMSSVLQADAGKQLAQVAARAERVPLIVNTRGIGELDAYAVSDLKQVIANHERTVAFFGNSALNEPLRSALGDPNCVFRSKDGTDAHVYGRMLDSKQRVDSLLQRITETERVYIERIIADCYRPFGNGPERLNSTPLLATGVFDARRAIGLRETFVPLALNLAEAVDHVLEEDKPSQPTLLAVSLRGSVLAAAVRLHATSGLQLVVVDHLGPKYMLFEEHSLAAQQPGSSFLLIADFIIGGTELSIAQAYAQRLGCGVSHAVVLGSALAQEQYRACKVRALTRLGACEPRVQWGFTRIEENI